MAIEIAETTTDELVAAMARLLPQLSSSCSSLTAAEVARFLDHHGVYLFVFRPDEPNEAGERPILGMLSLATFRIPTGLRAWVEDVVVDEAARGQGAGAALIRASLEFAKELGARTVDLTSRPTREAANRLYQRCGFKKRETNVYRYQIAD